MACTAARAFSMSLLERRCCAAGDGSTASDSLGGGGTTSVTWSEFEGPKACTLCSTNVVIFHSRGQNKREGDEEEGSERR